MDRIDQYKATFSQVHTAVRIEMEDIKTVNTTHRARKGVVALAAAFCLILACSATAYAMNLFGLKDMVLNKDSMEATNQASSEVTNDTAEAFNTEEMISLQGYPESDEYKACEEWTAFRDSYDKDGALLAQVGNNPTPFDVKYGLYLVYTQEMADKLDEITAKYGLALHSSIVDIFSKDDLFNKAGTGDFLGAMNSIGSAYMYEDGSFHIDGDAVLSNGKQISYQFMNYKKGSFSDVILNIGNADNYNEWTFKTSCGVTVSLAISPDKSLVIVDLGASFVTINVLAGTESGFLDETGKITASDLEAFADSFDFSMIK